MPNVVTCQSQRDDISQTRFVESSISADAPGTVVAEVNHFALTANNITYGVAGDTIGYWQFFPAEEGWGCIPVWGFGTVVESTHDEVPVGERVYGYFPMASHVRLQPTRVADHGWTDGVEHRQSLPPVYNQYARTAADPSWSADLEGEQMIYRPLFTTSFFLDDFVADNDGFGADTVVVVSASSKTAIGLAHLLHANRSDRFRVVGLTSAQNVEFVRGLGCYDEVLDYGSIAQLEQRPTMVVDMAGSGDVRRALHEHLGDSMTHDCAVGATHWEAAAVGGRQQALPGPQPAMFFAPSQIQKRLQEWGRETYDARMSAAWEGFLGVCSDWIQLEHLSGPDELKRIYGEFIAGRADPARGYVLSLS